MRVCHFTENFPPDQCGIGDYVKKLVNILSTISTINDVYIATLSKVQTGPNIVNLKKNFYTPELLKFVEDKKIEVVHFHIAYSITKNPMKNLSILLSIKKLFKRRVKVAVTFHQFPDKYLSKDVRAERDKVIKLIGFIRYFLDGLFARIYSSYFKFIDFSFVVDPAYKKLIHSIEKFDSKIEFLPVPSNIESVRPNENELEEYRIKYNMNRNYKWITYFGMIYQEKGFEDLLNLIANTEYRLLYIGDLRFDNIYRKSIKKHIDDLGLTEKIVSTGYVSSREVGILLQLGGACILPFKRGFSPKNASLLAALSQGVFTISTTSNSQDYGYDNKRNLYLVKPGDIKSMILATHRFFGQKVNPSNDLLTNWEDLKQKYAAVYKKLLCKS